MHWAHFVSASVFAVIRLRVCMSDWALNELQKVETIGHLFVFVRVRVWSSNELQSQMCACDRSHVKTVFLRLEE